MRRAALFGLLFLSGSAGLAYQTIWTRTFTVALGHEMPSLLAVVTAFLAGLSAGAWSLGRRIARSPRPHHWYAGFELLSALWALGGLVFFTSLADVAAGVLGIQPSPPLQWSVAFSLPFLGLLPATLAMGATLPAMEQILSRGSVPRRIVCGAYAANTAGAVVGVVGSVFFLMPALGQRGTLFVFVMINVICAAGVLLLGSTAAGASAAMAPTAPIRDRRLSLLLFAMGLLGIGYEVLAVRVMSQVFEGTLYSFATALAVYLAASSAGAALWQRLTNRVSEQRWLPCLLLALAYSTLAGMLVLYRAEGLYRSLRLTLGDSTLAVLVSETALSLSVFLLPSLLMGATFAYSRASRPAIPWHPGHPFRAIPASDSMASRPPIPRHPGHLSGG